MKRRTFLKRGLLGGVLLTVGGGTTLALWPSKALHRPTEALRALSPQAFNVMAAIAARVVTLPGADPVAIAHTIDRSLARAVPETRADLVQVLHLFDSAFTGLLDGQLGPFTSLSPEAQDEVLAAWRDSRLTLRRGAYRALRNLAATSHYRQESAYSDAGYPGPPAWLVAIHTAQAQEESP